MKIKHVLVIGLLFAIIAGCGDGASDNDLDGSGGGSTETEYATKTFFINSHLVDCVGVGPRMCMQVRENEQDEWEFFYDEIEGFTYEEGYLYAVLVEVVDVEDPPADASSIEYTLIEILSKEEV
jgi:hypothetical protein